MTLASFRRLLVLGLVATLLAACASLQAARFQGTALPVQPAPDFRLTDDRGQAWRLSRQRGTTIALFFGFTHCADTCPTTLAKLVRAIHDSGTQQVARVAFVTVDPARDTPAALARYDRQFTGGANVVGLTGSQAQIENVERAYHEWAQKIPGQRGGDDYDESHSANIYFIDNRGNERVVHDPDDSVASLAADLKTLQ